MSITSSACESSANDHVDDSHAHDSHVHDVQDFTQHDVAERLVAAKEQCRTRGVRFTPLRQQIYALVLQANKPVGAYDLITQLQQARLLDSDNETDTAKCSATDGLSQFRVLVKRGSDSSADLN